ncbi:hypothetical protein [Clostridium sp.]
MSNQFCPHCNVLRDMVVSTHENNEKIEESKILKIITNNYHCLICNAFVYSTDTEVLKEN